MSKSWILQVHISGHQTCILIASPSEKCKKKKKKQKNVTVVGNVTITVGKMMKVREKKNDEMVREM